MPLPPITEDSGSGHGTAVRPLPAPPSVFTVARMGRTTLVAAYLSAMTPRQVQVAQCSAREMSTDAIAAAVLAAGVVPRRRPTRMGAEFTGWWVWEGRADGAWHARYVLSVPPLLLYDETLPGMLGQLSAWKAAQ